MTENRSQMSTIQLRPVTKNDLPILFEHQRQPEANEMAAFPARDREAFQAHWMKILHEEAVLARTIVFDGCVVGQVGCWAQAGKRYVGYWMGKEHWGKGIATKMLSIFLQHLEERPLYAYVVKHNVASIRVLEKSGFALLAQEITSPNILLDENEELVYVLERPAQKDSYSVPTPE